MITRARQLPDIHPQACDCPMCEPNHPSSPLLSDDATRIGLLVLAGNVNGLILTVIYDAIVGGPGILVMFGL